MTNPASGRSLMEENDTKSVQIALDALFEESATRVTSRMSDKDRLEAFDTDVSALEARMEALNRAAQSRVASLKRARNASAPINLLPLELRQGIFCEVFEDPRSYRDVCNSMLVCKDWNDVARDCPRLWTRISIDLPPRLLTAFLQRSKNSGLVIQRDYCDERRFFGRRDAFFRTIVEHTRHWESCEVVVEEPQDLILLERSPAPMLNVLKLESETENATPLNLFGGQAPLLTHLKLIGVAILWDSMVCSHLKSIYIRGIHGSNCPTMHQILNMLQTAPLSSVSLSNMRIAPSGPATASPQTTFLSCMTSFTLCNIPLQAVNQLLNSVEFSKCAVSIYPSGTDHRSIGSEEGSGLRKLLNWLIRWGGKYFVDVVDGETLDFKTNCVTGSCCSLHMDSWGVSGSTVALLRWVLETLGPAFCQRITSLVLCIQRNWDDHAADILFPLQNLAKLELRGAGRTLHHALDLLGEPRPDGSDATLRWLCPDLVNLTITYCEEVDPEVLIRMLRSRYGRLPPASEAVNMALPRPFDLLSLDDTYLPHLQQKEMRQLVGEDAFQCDVYDTELETDTEE